MANAKKAKELFVTAIDEVGTLGRLSCALATAKVNILALQAFVIADKVHFRLVVDNAVLAMKKLKEIGFYVSLKDVIVVEFNNRPGVLAPVVKKFGSSGVDIVYCYGTTGDGEKANVVFSTRDDEKAMKIING